MYSNSLHGILVLTLYLTNALSEGKYISVVLHAQILQTHTQTLTNKDSFYD